MRNNSAVFFLLRSVQSLVGFEKVAQTGQLSDIAKSDECGIITNEDQNRVGAPDNNRNATKDYVSKSDQEKADSLKKRIANVKVGKHFAEMVLKFLIVTKLLDMILI